MKNKRWLKIEVINDMQSYAELMQGQEQARFC